LEEATFPAALLAFDEVVFWPVADLAFEPVLVVSVVALFPADLADFEVDCLLVDLTLEEAALLAALAFTDPDFTEDFALAPAFAADFAMTPGADLVVDLLGTERSLVAVVD